MKCVIYITPGHVINMKFNTTIVQTFSILSVNYLYSLHSESLLALFFKL